MYSSALTINCKNNNITKINKNIYDESNGEYCKIVNFKKEKLLFLYTKGMVNNCGILLNKNKDNIYNKYFLSDEICNIQIIKNMIISTYRDQGKWYYRILFEDNKKKIYRVDKLTPKTLTQYNNIAYYLQKAGANEEAVYLLEKIIKKFPKRTVAYINLGDAYRALGEKDKARKAYTTYIEQMCAKGLQKKIPKKVLERVESKK